VSKLYLLTVESTGAGTVSVAGAFLTPQAAMSSRPGEWKRSRLLEVWTRPTTDEEHRELFGESLAVYEIDFCIPNDPITAFGFAVLAGDPVAQDAVRDLLKL
jgi:hypothetical protein